MFRFSYIIDFNKHSNEKAKKVKKGEPDGSP
jgi:hypothetical protein